MKGDFVPDADHVARLCGGSHIREDGSVAATAFMLRPGETYLSVNWLEHLGLVDRASQIAEIRRVLSSKRSIGATAKISVLNVGAIRAIVLRDRQGRSELMVLHEPEIEPGRPQDPSHCGIFGVLDDDGSTAELITRAILELHPVR